MGTDIHSIAQVKRGDRWVTVAGAVGDDLRDYATFAVLAGIRNDHLKWPKISPPRGLPSGLEPRPDDRVWCPVCLGEDLWLGDHSHSWVTLTEIKDMIENVLKRNIFVIPPPYGLRRISVFLEFAKSYWSAKSDDDVRLVFGFDS